MTDLLDRLDRRGLRPDLERMRSLCRLAGHPEAAFPAVLVAGTNGKGSTCAFLASILRAAGLRVGTAPKPHLYTPRERVQVDGAPIPPSEFTALLETVAPWIRSVEAGEAGPAQGPVTYFEAMTLVALLWFRRCGVDWAVIEVGLGGRLDATNSLEPRMSLITNIGLDHLDRLGPDLAGIAAEKAGILRPATPAITGAAGEGLAVIEATAARLGAPLWRSGEEIEATTRRLGPDGCRFDLRTPAGCWEDLRVRLAGAHQVANAALAGAAAAWLAAEGLPVSAAAVRAGLQAATIPARLETVRRKPLLLLDAAHNPDGARALVAALRDIYLRPGRRRVPRRLILVVGLSAAHQPDEMAQVLAPAADLLIATSSAHEQALPAAETAALLRAHAVPPAPVEAAVPVAAAAGLALARAGEEDVVCVTGSIFVLAELEGARLA